MHTRRLGAVVAVVGVVLALSGCGSSSNNSASSGSTGGGGGKPYIAIVSKGFQHQFWQAVKKGAEQEAAKEGARITFEGPATEQDIEAQITMLTNALTKKPAAIGFAALDSKSAAPLLAQAKASKIPVIAFDSGVESDIPVTT
ncbi:MAG: ribose transport system substrate-binding protein, partial [Actinomycetota bacterium]|nr:ribose transport system substrate-binding protein [Actinomycetota bacterium]